MRSLMPGVDDTSPPPERLALVRIDGLIKKVSNTAWKRSATTEVGAALRVISQVAADCLEEEYHRTLERGETPQGFEDQHVVVHPAVLEEGHE